MTTRSRRPYRPSLPPHPHPPIPIPIKQEEEIFSKIIKFQAYAADKDFVMVSGARITSRGALGAPGSSTFYTKLALALNLPVLLVHDMKNTMGCSDMTVDSSGVTRSLSVEALKASMAGFSANAKQMAVRLAGAIVTGLPDEEEKYAEASTVVRTALDEFKVHPACCCRGARGWSS